MRWRLLFGLGLPAGAALSSYGDDSRRPRPVISRSLPSRSRRWTCRPGPSLPSEPAPIKAMNRTVATLRSSLLGWSAKMRAQVAEARIRQMLAKPGDRKLSLLDRPEGTAVLADDELLFAVLLQDTVQGTSVAARLEAQQAAEVLGLAIDEARESRDPHALLIGAAFAAVATLVLAVLLTLLLRARRRIQAWLERKTHEQSKQWRLGGIELLSSEHLIAAERVTLGVLFWLVAALLFYQWAGVALAQFPYTRVWGEELNGFLFSLVGALRWPSCTPCPTCSRPR